MVFRQLAGGRVDIVASETDVLPPAMAELNAAVPRPPGVELAVRIGIATGPVIVGDQIGEGTASETAVVGEAPDGH